MLHQRHEQPCGDVWEPRSHFAAVKT